MDETRFTFTSLGNWEIAAIAELPEISNVEKVVLTTVTSINDIDFSDSEDTALITKMRVTFVDGLVVEYDPHDEADFDALKYLIGQVVFDSELNATLVPGRLAGNESAIKILKEIVMSEESIAGNRVWEAMQLANIETLDTMKMNSEDPDFVPSRIVIYDGDLCVAAVIDGDDKLLNPHNTTHKYYIDALFKVTPTFGGNEHPSVISRNQQLAGQLMVVIGQPTKFGKVNSEKTRLPAEHVLELLVDAQCISSDVARGAAQHIRSLQAVPMALVNAGIESTHRR